MTAQSAKRLARMQGTLVLSAAIHYGPMQSRLAAAGLDSKSDMGKACGDQEEGTARTSGV